MFSHRQFLPIGLREQLAEIKGLMTRFINPPPSKDEEKISPKIHPVKNMHPDERLSSLMEELCKKADVDGSTGAVTYLGIYSSGGQQSGRIKAQVDTDSLLKLIESRAAAKVLACIGNNDRLNILLALLRAPSTVAQLVDQCGFNTTGQVYHHLKPLLAVDLITEDEHSRGVYLIQPHRVHGIFMLLAGIGDMLDTHYTQGNWEWAEDKPAAQ